MKQLLTYLLPAIVLSLALGWFALNRLTTYRLLLRNESGAMVDEVKIEGPGVRVRWVSIPSGGERSTTASFDGDGRVTYEARTDGVVQGGIVLGYVTRGLRGRAVLRVGKDGGLRVDR